MQINKLIFPLSTTFLISLFFLAPSALIQEAQASEKAQEAAITYIAGKETSDGQQKTLDNQIRRNIQRAISNAGSTGQFGERDKVRISVLYDKNNNYRVMINTVDDKRIKVSIHNRGKGTVRTDIFSQGSGDTLVFIHNKGTGRLVVDTVERQKGK